MATTSSGVFKDRQISPPSFVLAPLPLYFSLLFMGKNDKQLKLAKILFAELFSNYLCKLKKKKKSTPDSYGSLIRTLESKHNIALCVRITEETQEHPECAQCAGSARSGRVTEHLGGAASASGPEGEEAGDTAAHSLGERGGYRCRRSPIITFPPHRRVPTPLPSNILFDYLC